MGSWSVSITGNDTASDLRIEYAAAFFRYDVEEALKKIDAYVRAEMFDESDEEEWCDYYYSLADFMWKKGILTDEVRDKAIEMIDSGFGLEPWEEAGQKTLEARKKKLEEFKEKLLSPQPARKKIKPNTHTETIFEPGDIVAVQLQTAGKPYTENDQRTLSDEEFHSFDGKYVLMQLIKCYSSWTSSIVPEVKDYWAEFRLFEGTYDTVPEHLDFSLLKEAQIVSFNKLTARFTCESSMFYFKRRKYQLLANRKDLLEQIGQSGRYDIFWGINKPWYNPDSKILAAMGKEIRIGEYQGDKEQLMAFCRRANRYGRRDYRISEEEQEAQYAKEEEEIARNLKTVLAEGGRLIGITFGKEMGVAFLQGCCVKGIFVEGKFREIGFGTKLLEYALSCAGEGGYIEVPSNQEPLIRVCEKLKLKAVQTDKETIIYINEN